MHADCARLKLMKNIRSDLHPESDELNLARHFDSCRGSMDNVKSPVVEKAAGEADGGSGVAPSGSSSGAGVKLVCSLPPAYLNAELYRGQPPRQHPLPPPHLDFLHIAADGKGLLGRSDMTGRLWNGLAQTVDLSEDLLKITNENMVCPSMQGHNGMSDGRFMLDTTKVILVDDAGDLMVWARQPLWSGIAKSGDQFDAWCVSCSACEHDDGISAVDLSSTGDKIVTGGNDNCIKVWDLSLISIETYRPAHTQLVSDIACHPIDADTFLSSSLDGTVALWDSKCVGSKAKVLQTMLCAARCVCWLTDKLFVVGYENGDVIVHDVTQNDAKICKINLKYPIHRIVYNERTKCLAVCGDSCELRVYKFDEKTNLKLIYEDTRHTEFVRGLAWNNCDTINLYSCGWDTKIFEHSFSTK